MLKPTVPWSKDELIKSHDFLNFVAKALHPDLKSLRGISCIVKRRMPVSPQIAGLASAKFNLTDSHKEELQKVFPEISSLRGDMSSGEINDFYKKYRLLDNKLPWTPVFNVATKKKLQQNRSNQYDLMGKHGLQLQEAMNAGEIVGLNDDHIPQKHLGRGVLISYNHAIKYLKEYSIPHTLRTDINLNKEKLDINSELIEKEIANKNSETSHQEKIKKIPIHSDRTEVKENTNRQEKTKRKRRENSLTLIIVDAQTQCKNPYSTTEVLSKLRQKARNREDGLIENTSGEIQWRKVEGGKYQTLTRRKLHGRLRTLKLKAEEKAANSATN